MRRLPEAELILDSSHWHTTASVCVSGDISCLTSRGQSASDLKDETLEDKEHPAEKRLPKACTRGRSSARGRMQSKKHHTYLCCVSSSGYTSCSVPHGDVSPIILRTQRPRSWRTMCHNDPGRWRNLVTLRGHAGLQFQVGQCDGPICAIWVPPAWHSFPLSDVSKRDCISPIPASCDLTSALDGKKALLAGVKPSRF